MKVVLLPGMDGTGLLFRDFLAALPTDIEAVTVSYPGDRALDYAALEEFVRGCLPNGDPFALLAESFSGPLAISVAAAPPNGLVGVILCSSFARCPRPALRPIAALVSWAPLPRLPTAWIAPLVLGRFGSPKRCVALSEALSQVSPCAFRARVQALLATDVSAKLPNVRMPLLYLRGLHDRLVPRSVGDHIVELAPRTRIVEFAAPHFLLQTVPAEAAEVVAGFTREVGSGAG